MGESVAMIPHFEKSVVIVRLSVKTWVNSLNQTTLVAYLRRFETGPLDITQKIR